MSGNVTEWNEGLDDLIALLNRQHNAYVANGAIIRARQTARVMKDIERKRIK